MHIYTGKCEHVCVYVQQTITSEQNMWKIVWYNFDTATKQRFPLKQQTEALVENKPQNRTQKLIEKR